MIVLRIDVSGHSADVRWAGAEAVLGSGAAAAIQRDDAGWGPREAVIVHLGSEVLVVRSDGSGEHRLTLGDSMEIGKARLTLVGLLPLRADLDDEGDETPAYFESPGAAAGTEPATLAEEAKVAGLDADAKPPSVGEEWMPTLAGDEVPAGRSATEGKSPSPAASAPVLTMARAEAAGRSEAAAGAALGKDPAAQTPPAAAPLGASKAADARWRQGTFEDEIYGAIKRTPWFMLSLAIHALLFGLLLVLEGTPAPRAHEEPRYGLLTAQADLPDVPDDSGGPKDRTEPERPPEEYTAPDDAEPEPPDTTPDVPRPKPPAAADAPVPEPVPNEARPSDIGLSRSVIALRTKPQASSPKPATPAAGDDWVNHDPDRAIEVNQKAAARVRDDIKRGGGTLGAALKGLKREDILVVRGNFDHMEAVLEELKIPYTLVSPFDLFQDYDFQRHKLVFWNCMDPEVSLPPRHRPRIVSALREFVRGGGFLFTTDWSISFLLAPAFPGYLESSGGINPLPEMILPVQATRHERDNPLLEGVFPEGTRVLWWLETASQDIKVARGANVDVLIESRMLDAPPKPRSPIVAATFEYGKGRVLHVMGHYYQQKGNVAGAAGAQRLALNFVRMKLEKDKPPAK